MASASPGFEPTTVRDPLLGAKLGEYEVLKPLGEGGMGVVYEGLHTVINKRVAIKVIKSEFAGDQVLVRRVLAEAQAVNAVRHRGIVDIHAHGLTPDGRPYLVMELLQGETLFDLVGRRGGKLPREEALKVLLDATGPLIAAHKAGIVHRDLKPTNLFLCDEDDGERFLKLLDFGLAKRSAPGVTSSTMTSAALIVGTPDYMAPEQARAQPTDLRTDIYSLGVLAFELLSGQLPYAAPTTVDLVMKHLSAPVPKLIEADPTMPVELSNLVEQMMAKEPSARPQSLDPVRAVLKQVASLPDVAVARATPFRRSDETFVGEAPAPTPPPPDDGNAATAPSLKRLEPRPSGRRQVKRAPSSDTTAELSALGDGTARLPRLEDKPPTRSKGPFIVLGALVLLAIVGGVIAFRGPSPSDDAATTVVPKRVEPLIEKPDVENHEELVKLPPVEKPVEKPKPVVVEKPKPPPPPVEKVEKVEKPVVVEKPKPVRKVATADELSARMDALAKEAQGHSNIALPKLLTKYRADLQRDSSEKNRAELSKTLDAFQMRLREP